MIIKNMPTTTKQKIKIAKVKNVLNAPSIYLKLINKDAITVTQVDIVSLTKIILYFLPFDKD